MPSYTQQNVATTPSYTAAPSAASQIFNDTHVIFNDLVVRFNGGNVNTYTQQNVATTPTYTRENTPS